MPTAYNVPNPQRIFTRRRTPFNATVSSPLPVLFGPLTLELTNDAPLFRLLLSDVQPVLRCVLADTPAGDKVSNLTLTGATVVLSVLPMGSSTAITTVSGIVTDALLCLVDFVFGAVPLAALLANGTGIYKAVSQVTFASGASVTFGLDTPVWLQVRP